MGTYFEQLVRILIELNYVVYHIELNVHAKDDEIQEESLSISCDSLLIKKKQTEGKEFERLFS